MNKEESFSHKEKGGQFLVHQEQSTSIHSSMNIMAASPRIQSVIVSTVK